MADPIEVFVQISGQDTLAGRLWMRQTRGGGSATFEYDPTYIASREAYELGPDLPLVSGSQHTPVGKSLFGALTDTAPDRWGRRLINRAEAAIAKEEGRAQRSILERDYLLGARDDLRQGALRYRESGGTEFLAVESAGVPPVVGLAALLNASEALEKDTATSRDLRLLLRGGSSLGGARPKAHVLDKNGNAAIAKFPSAEADEWDVNRWEAVALTLADQAGIATAKHQLITVESKPVVIVERFDREANGDRIGYISALTMMSGIDGQDFDYLDLAEQIEQESAAPARDLRELWARCAYGRLISNTDDHFRNHGFLRGASGWNLSPAFDLNPNPYRSNYSTAFGGDDQGSLRPLIEHADLFRMSSDDVAATLRRITEATSAWRQVAASHGLPSASIDLMEPAFEVSARQEAVEHVGVRPVEGA